MATRFTAAAAIGLVGGVLTLQAASAAVSGAAVAGRSAPSGSIPFSVAAPAIAPRPVVIATVGGERARLLRAAGSTGVRVAADKIPAQAPAKVPAKAPATARAAAAPKPTAPHPAPAPSAPASAPKKPRPHLPFHRGARKAARLPDTGVPMSAALGAVTALTALLAGIGTVVAARRCGDR
ncbi:MAG: hypothetical protein ACJ786_11200 [Catenulispora sp.]